MIQNALRRCSSFNVIHLATIFKVDVFVPQDTPFACENMHWRVALEVPEIGRTLYFCAPEAIVLHKLLWYAARSGVSDRQWYDLQGVGCRPTASTWPTCGTGRRDSGWRTTHRALDEAGLSDV